MALRAHNLCVAICVLTFAPSISRAGVPSSSSAATLIRNVASTFSSGRSIGSVQLSGTISRYSGDSSDSGPITLTATADGAASLSYQLSDGTRTESQTAAKASRSCQWSGPDGVMHDSTNSHCWSALVWYLPQISLQPNLQPSSFVMTDPVLQSTATGSIYAFQSQLDLSSVMKNRRGASHIQVQSTTLIAVDATTFLPSVLQYTIQSDDGPRMIAVEVRYSNYRNVGGLILAGHIERYLNGGLELAIDITQASILN